MILPILGSYSPRPPAGKLGSWHEYRPSRARPLFGQMTGKSMTEGRWWRFESDRSAVVHSLEPEDRVRFLYLSQCCFSEPQGLQRFEKNLKWFGVLSSSSGHTIHKCYKPYIYLLCSVLHSKQHEQNRKTV